MTPVILRAVPSRADWVAYITRHVPHVRVLVDPDYGKAGTDGMHRGMAAFLRAMEAAGDGPAVHLEDDIVLTENFVEKMVAAVAERPNRVIQFFSMRKADLTEGSRWDRAFSMNQCFYLPPLYSKAIGVYTRSRWVPAHPEHPGGYDLAMNDWLKSRKESHWIHCPNLVDHRVCVSAMDSRRSSRRQSFTFRDPAGE